MISTIRPTFGRVTKGRAAMQASANTDTKVGTVKVTATDASGNVTSADVLLDGQIQVLGQVPNRTGIKLWVGAKVTINYVSGNRYKPQIIAVASQNSANALSASTDAISSAAAQGTSAPTSLKGYPFLLQSPSSDLGGYVEKPGANVAFTDQAPAPSGSGGSVTPGSRTITAKPLVALSLPNPATTTLPDGTCLDLIDSYNNPTGMYRLDRSGTVPVWRRRDSGGGGGTGSTIDASQIVSGTVTPSRLPVATATVIGAVKTGVGLSVATDGTLNVVGGGSGVSSAEVIGSTPDYSLTSSYANVSFGAALQIAFPAAGNYQITAELEAVADASNSNDDIYAQLYNLTDAIVIPGSERSISYLPAGKRGQLILRKLISVTAAKTICVQAKNATSARGTLTAVRSAMDYISIGTIVASGTTTTKPSYGVGLNPSDPLTSSLVAFWAFNEGSGATVHDLTTNGNHLALTGSPTWGTVSSGNVLSFNSTGVGGSFNTGVNQYGKATRAASLEPSSGITVAIRVNICGNTALHYCDLIRKYLGSSPYTGYTLRWTENGSTRNAAFQQSISSATNYNTAGNQSAYMGAYHWFILTADGASGVIKFYIDTTLISSASSSTGSLAYSSDDLFLMTSTTPSQPGQGNVGGDVDLAFIAARALTSTEISGIVSNPYASFW